jgi:hypothetical protein
MAAREVDERGEATDGVNGAVKPLQKGAAARPKMMIETDFMVETVDCSTLHKLCCQKQQIEAAIFDDSSALVDTWKVGPSSRPQEKTSSMVPTLAHNISVDELMMTSTSRKAATIQQTVYSHSCALQVHC